MRPAIACWASHRACNRGTVLLDEGKKQKQWGKRWMDNRSKVSSRIHEKAHLGGFYSFIA